MVQFDCHPEQAAFAPRGIWASRALRRVLCDATIARLARFLTKLKASYQFTFIANWNCRGSYAAVGAPAAVNN